MDGPRGGSCAGRGRLRDAQRFGPVAPVPAVAPVVVERQHLARGFVGQPVHLRWAAVALGRHALGGLALDIGQPRVVRRTTVFIRRPAVVVRDIGVGHAGRIRRVAGAGRRARPAALANPAVRRNGRPGRPGRAGRPGRPGRAGRPSAQRWRAVIVRRSRRPGFVHRARQFPGGLARQCRWLDRRSSVFRRCGRGRSGRRPGHG
jgi:hypothetical protein